MSRKAKPKPAANTVFTPTTPQTLKLVDARAVERSGRWTAPAVETKVKDCACLARANQALASVNATLVGIICLNTAGPRAIVAIEKKDTTLKAQLPVLVASFCPFCGWEYA